MTQPTTDQDRSDLAACKHALDQDKDHLSQTSRRVLSSGRALRMVKDRALYRHEGHKELGTWTKINYGYLQDQADKYIRCADRIADEQVADWQVGVEGLHLIASASNKVFDVLMVCTPKDSSDAAIKRACEAGAEAERRGRDIRTAVEKAYQNKAPARSKRRQAGPRTLKVLLRAVVSGLGALLTLGALILSKLAEGERADPALEQKARERFFALTYQMERWLGPRTPGKSSNAVESLDKEEKNGPENEPPERRRQPRQPEAAAESAEAPPAAVTPEPAPAPEPTPEEVAETVHEPLTCAVEDALVEDEQKVLQSTLFDRLRNETRPAEREYFAGLHQLFELRGVELPRPTFDRWLAGLFDPDDERRWAFTFQFFVWAGLPQYGYYLDLLRVYLPLLSKRKKLLLRWELERYTKEQEEKRQQQSSAGWEAQPEGAAG